MFEVRCRICSHRVHKLAILYRIRYVNQQKSSKRHANADKVAAASSKVCPAKTYFKRAILMSGEISHH